MTEATEAETLKNPKSEFHNLRFLIVDASDNVAVIKQGTWPGLELVLPDGHSLKVLATVLPDRDARESGTE